MPSQDKDFFYAQEEAALYDQTIGYTTPHYELMHQALLEFTASYFEGKDLRDGMMIDIGAGTGKESLGILKLFPNVHVAAIDVSQEMQPIFEHNFHQLFNSEVQKPSYQYIKADIRELDFSKSVAGFRHKKKIACISAFCIHHFPLNEKRKIYQKMYDCLDKGGLFINLDLFNYKSKNMSIFAHRHGLEFIEDSFDDAIAKNPNQGAKLESLKHDWIDHMNTVNLLDSMEIQISDLREIGFKDVECIYRFLQQGLIAAIK